MFQTCFLKWYVKLSNKWLDQRKPNKEAVSRNSEDPGKTVQGMAESCAWNCSQEKSERS